jgi:hypothetical protein
MRVWFAVRTNLESGDARGRSCDPCVIGEAGGAKNRSSGAGFAHRMRNLTPAPGLQRLARRRSCCGALRREVREMQGYSRNGRLLAPLGCVRSALADKALPELEWMKSSRQVLATAPARSTRQARSALAVRAPSMKLRLGRAPARRKSTQSSRAWSSVKASAENPHNHSACCRWQAHSAHRAAGRA